MIAGGEHVLPTMLVDRDCPFATRLSAITFGDRVAELDAGQLLLDPHPAVATDIPPDWSMDPFKDANWRFQLHSLRWVQNLKRSFDQTSDPRRLKAYLSILEHWLDHNPWSSPPSDQSWGDHSTALRTRVYAACAQAMQSPWPSWLRLALETHVDVLAGPDLYPSGGNHALNQNVGLFAAASLLGRDDEAVFAIDRTAELLERSVDEEGVTDEQSSEYQVYNFRRYHEATDLFRTTGVELPAVFDRIDRMPEFIGHATLPNGRDVMIGDAVDVPARAVEGTVAEFAASRGERGTRPSARTKVFRAGYVFARTGWGERRPIEQETHLSLRFGPARIPHGHHDAMAISLASHGQRIISHAGKYAYVWDEMRRYVLSRRAQNSIHLIDRPYGPDGGSELVDAHTDHGLFVVSIRDHHYPDVALMRTVAFDFDAGATLVIDRFEALDGREVTAEQRFRLDPAFEAGLDASAGGVVARHPQGPQVTLRHLTDVDDLRIVRGEQDPVDGWVSYRYGEQTPTSVIVSTCRSRAGSFVTELSVHDDAPTVLRPVAGNTAMIDETTGHVRFRDQAIELPPLSAE